MRGMQRLKRGKLQFERLDAHLHHVQTHRKPALDDAQLTDLALDLDRIQRCEHRRWIGKGQHPGHHRAHHVVHG